MVQRLSHTRTRKRGYRRPPEKRVPCEVWTRVVGYLRPVQSFADHKRLEFKQRQVYKVEAE